MNLHEDQQTFVDLIRLTADHLHLPEIFIEKDYWVTRSLCLLAASPQSEIVVFKGGTSLSKAYKIIQRFSEDVDLALIPLSPPRSGGQTRTALKKLTQITGEGLEELEGGTKSSNIRKIYYEYPSIITGQPYGHASERLLIEINAFADPFPSSSKAISTYIYEFLFKKGFKEGIERYNLQPFEISVLSLGRTFSEKIMSLIKASNASGAIQQLRSKVRHLYDLNQLLTHQEVKDFLLSDYFFETIDKIKQDDAKSPTGNEWTSVPLASNILFNDPEKCWRDLEQTYTGEFKKMVFGDLPSPSKILSTIHTIAERLQEYDRTHPA